MIQFKNAFWVQQVKLFGNSIDLKHQSNVFKISLSLTFFHLKPLKSYSQKKQVRRSLLCFGTSK